MHRTAFARTWPVSARGDHPSPRSASSELNDVLDAVNPGYQVVVPGDAVAGLPAAYVDAVFEHTLGLVATITTTAQIVSVWRRAA